jgi:4-diphosphocytidyl-2-C-methyl-D-erythritol kinase
VPTQAQLKVFSPAKVNLFLNILGKRPDGYHELETVMAPLDFGDEITLQLRKTGLVLECDNPNLPTDESNLAYRAAKILTKATGVEQGAKIVLRKRIPLAAGLAGGSSNAATVLTGLNQLWQAGATPAQLNELAAGMGSDINFFFAGGAAVCRGRGEQVEPVACKLSATVLLINPGFGIATPWAYRNWRPPLTAKLPDVTLLRRGLASDDLDAVARSLHNSLEAPCLRKFPVLRLLQDTMREQGAAGAMMSGSGATVFGLFREAAVAEQAGRVIQEQFGPSMWTEVARIAGTAR